MNNQTPVPPANSTQALKNNFYHSVKDYMFFFRTIGKTCRKTDEGEEEEIALLSDNKKEQLSSKCLSDRLTVGLMTAHSHDPDKVRRNGAGFIYDEEGHIATCAHVSKNSDTMKVHYDERICLGTKIGEDFDKDISVLKVDPECLKAQATFKEVYKSSVNDHCCTAYFKSTHYKRWKESGYFFSSWLLEPKSDKCFGLTSSNKRVMCLGITNAEVGCSGSPVLSSYRNGVKLWGMAYKVLRFHVPLGVSFAIPSNTVKSVADKIISDYKEASNSKEASISTESINIEINPWEIF